MGNQFPCRVDGKFQTLECQLHWKRRCANLLYRPASRMRTELQPASMRIALARLVMSCPLKFAWKSWHLVRTIPPGELLEASTYPDNFRGNILVTELCSSLKDSVSRVIPFRFKPMGAFYHAVMDSCEVPETELYGTKM
jgi:hypothetical protein